MKQRIWLSAWLAGVALLGPPVWAESAFDDLLGRYKEADKAWKAAQPDGGKPDWSKHPVHEYRKKMTALAQESAGKPAAVQPLMWLMEATARGGEEQAIMAGKLEALQTLTRAHAGDPAIAEVFNEVRYSDLPSADVVSFFEQAESQLKDAEARGRARLALGSYYVDTTDRECLPTPPGVKDSTDEAKPAARGDADCAALRAKAKKLFEQVKAECAEFKFAERAESALYELANLQIGLTAPEIVGRDVDDKELKLSQYRGQVVVLKFWGFW